MRKFGFSLLCILYFVSCTTKSGQQSDSYSIKTVQSKGKILPNAQLKKQGRFDSDYLQPKIFNAEHPTVVSAESFIRSLAIKKSVPVKVPQAITPGADTFKLPLRITITDSSFIAGIPESIIAKDAYIKDQNPHNFSSYGKLQGLKHGTINCLLEDQFGNIWIATAGGGVSKFDGKQFSHLTEAEGLCNNNVMCLFQDSRGTIWMGTDGSGITKYDGKHFTTYNDKNGLTSNTVVCINEDQSGNIWIGTNGGGVIKYTADKNKNTGSFEPFTSAEGLAGNHVSSILIDKSGNIWFGTVGGGVSKFNGKQFLNYTIENGLSHNKILCLLEDRQGIIWMGTDGSGVCSYDGKTFTHYSENNPLFQEVVWSIYEDKKGQIWLGSWGKGLSKFDGDNFTHYTEKEGLSSNIILSILEDQSGNIWLGTNGGGASVYHGNLFTHFTEKEGLNNNYVRDFSEDQFGNLWFATYGGGISKFNGQSFFHFNKQNGVFDNDVRCLMFDNKNELWFGTFGGGIGKYDGKNILQLTEEQGLCNNYILCMEKTHDGKLWFGTNGGGISIYDGTAFTTFDEETGLSNNTVLCITEDKNKSVWIGTNGGGVIRYDGRTFTHFDEKTGLSNNTVRSILADRNGTIWFGTSGGGICNYDGEKFIHITEKEGLKSNYILSILEDKEGNIWFGTRFGLSKLSTAQQSELNNKIANGSTKESDVYFKNYAYEDGFLGIGVNGGKTIYQDKKGLIWIGSNDRLTQLHPDGEIKNNKSPEIRITNLNLFNEKIPWQVLELKQDSVLKLGNGVSVGDFEFSGTMNWNTLPENLSLAFNNNYLTFQYIGITMHQPDLVKYRYILEGWDENWSSISTRTEVAYGNLQEGEYTFKVKAMNSEGLWSEPASYTFSIRPPWWKTTWFKSSYISAFILLIIGSFRWRTASLRRRQKQLEQTVIERTEELVLKNQQVEKQKEIVEEKNKEILSSITYAKRIQEAILPGFQRWKRYLPESFILYTPKDIVAGDFYWMEKSQNFLFIAAADCTGHGIPGAMVSVICSNALTRAISEEKLSDTNKILNRVREIVIENLSGKEEETVRDGMDICLIRIDTNKPGEIQFSGANRPLWIARNKQLLEFKPDKQAIVFLKARKILTLLLFNLKKEIPFIFSQMDMPISLAATMARNLCTNV
ncbi:MAG TPA: two-component regulator propeller domain-containing protein [Flavobacteriales bacterium]|nr:two-component regulator propeller domain-containing protein [Flavobacteriales bacterium]